VKQPWIVLAVAISIALCACGRYLPGASPTVTVSSSTGSGYTVTVTEQDRAATLLVGQKLLVELHAKPGMSDWAGVRSSDPAVLAPLTIDVMVPRGVTVAAFQAAGPGEAEVTAVAGALCSPGLMCPAYMVLYALGVHVEGGPPAS
jgi:hypothetical protein